MKISGFFEEFQGTTIHFSFNSSIIIDFDAKIPSKVRVNNRTTLTITIETGEGKDRKCCFNIMASERIETAEKIVRMTEWNAAEPWEFAEGEVASVDTLAAAKRFVSAQHFLLAWQEGKVPTGWRRPRRLTDFDGKYPKSVVDEAEEFIAERIAARNMQKTAKINAVLSAAGKAKDGCGANENISAGLAADEGLKRGKTREKKKISAKDVDAVKKDFAQFSSDLFEAKNALRTAMNAAADVSLRIDALTKTISQH